MRLMAAQKEKRSAVEMGGIEPPSKSISKAYLRAQPNCGVVPEANSAKRIPTPCPLNYSLLHGQCRRVVSQEYYTRAFSLRTRKASAALCKRKRRCQIFVGSFVL